MAIESAIGASYTVISGCRPGGLTLALFKGGGYLHKMRTILMLWRRSQRASRKKCWLEYSLGFGLTALDIKVFKVVAQILAFLKFITEAYQHIKESYACAKRLRSELLKEPLPKPLPWKNHQKTIWLSHSTTMFWQQTYLTQKEKLERIADLSRSTITELAQALLSLEEARLTAYLDPEIQRNNQIEMFVNAFELNKTIAEEGDELIALFEKQHKAVDAVFKTLKTGFTAHEACEQMKKIVSSMRQIEEVATPLREKYGEIVLEAFKRGSCAVLAGLGLAPSIPKELLVDSVEIQIREKKITHLPILSYEQLCLVHLEKIEKPTAEKAAEPPSLHRKTMRQRRIHLAVEGLKGLKERSFA